MANHKRRSGGGVALSEKDFIYNLEESNLKEIYKKLPLRSNGEKPSVIYVMMGSVDIVRPDHAFEGSDIIELLKLITDQVERSHKSEVYIWEDSTLSDFCYCVLGEKILKENMEK